MFISAAEINGTTIWGSLLVAVMRTDNQVTELYTRYFFSCFSFFFCVSASRKKEKNITYNFSRNTSLQKKFTRNAINLTLSFQFFFLASLIFFFCCIYHFIARLPSNMEICLNPRTHLQLLQNKKGTEKGRNNLWNLPVETFSVRTIKSHEKETFVHTAKEK